MKVDVTTHALTQHIQTSMRGVRTLAMMKTTQWNVTLSNFCHNIAGGLLIDLQALAHKNMSFSSPQLAFSNSLGCRRCQCRTLCLMPESKVICLKSMSDCATNRSVLIVVITVVLASSV